MQPAKHTRDSEGKKGTFSGFMEMRSGEKLLGRQALEQSGACVLGRRVWGGLILARKTAKTTASPVNRHCVFLDWAGEGLRFTGIREQH